MSAIDAELDRRWRVRILAWIATLIGAFLVGGLVSQLVTFGIFSWLMARGGT